MNSLNFGKVTGLFGRTKELENQIDEFLDKVTEAGLIFQRAVDLYLDKGPCREFEGFLKDIEQVESRADNLRREIESKLYAQTLIPELRGDVLRLMENVDHIINIFEANLFRFSIQSPDIPSVFNKGYSKLTETVVTATDAMVLAARSFFRDLATVRDNVSKILFYETEADRISTELQRKVFASDLPLDRKRHLTYFVERIDDLANTAEDVADEIAIYAIKRTI